MKATGLKDLLIATNNKGKLKEIESAYTGLPLSLLSLRDFPELPHAEESGTTYAENAAIKSIHYSTITGKCSLADDSGLEVQSIGNLPGIRSARFGDATSDEERINLLLTKLSSNPNRKARFICALSIAEPGLGVVRSFHGECSGTISKKRIGSGGFGYDSVFIPDGFVNTFAELSFEVKNLISHRARALSQARHFLWGWCTLDRPTGDS